MFRGAGRPTGQLPRRRPRIIIMGAGDLPANPTSHDDEDLSSRVNVRGTRCAVASGETSISAAASPASEATAHGAPRTAHRGGNDARARSHGKRQMSSTPLVAWEFEFPSGSAIFPSITIGVFQCPPPQARFASCTPVSDRYTRRPPPGAYTKRRVSATTGLVPALRFDQTGCSWPLVNRHAAVPPPSAANSQVPVAPRSTAGALNRPPPLGVDTTCASPPWCAVAPLIALQSSTRISPSFPLCAINPPPSRTGDVDPTSVSLASSAAVLVGV